MPWSIELVDRDGYAVAERVWMPESKKPIQPLSLPTELDESLSQSRTPTIQRKTRVSPQSSSSSSQSQSRRTQNKPYDHAVEAQTGRRSEQPQMYIPSSSYQYNDILHIQELQEQYYSQNRSSFQTSTSSSQPNHAVYYFPVPIPIQHFSKFQTPVEEQHPTQKENSSSTSSPTTRFSSPSPSSSSSSVHSSPRSRLLSPCSDRSSASSFSSPSPSPLSSPSSSKRPQYQQPILHSQPHTKSETSLYLPPEFFNPPLDFSDDDSEMFSPSSLRSGSSCADEGGWMFQEMETSLEDPFTGMMRFDAEVEV